MHLIRIRRDLHPHLVIDPLRQQLIVNFDEAGVVEFQLKFQKKNKKKNATISAPPSGAESCGCFANNVIKSNGRCIVKRPQCAPCG